MNYEEAQRELKRCEQEIEKEEGELKKISNRKKSILNPEEYEERMAKKKERVEYRKELREDINKYLEDKVDVLKRLYTFVNNEIKKDKNDRINIEAFNKGYDAITGKYQVTTKDMEKLFGDKEDIDCKKDPVVCNYKYFMKTFYFILNKDNKLSVLEEMKKYLKENTQNRSVNEVVEKSSDIKAWSLQKAKDNFSNKKNMLFLVDSADIKDVIALYKFLMDKEQVKKIKSQSKEIREFVNKIKNKCYNRLHYAVNQEHLKLHHAVSVLSEWHKEHKQERKKRKLSKKEIEEHKEKQRKNSKDNWKKNKDKQIRKERNRRRGRLFFLKKKREKLLGVLKNTNK